MGCPWGHKESDTTEATRREYEPEWEHKMVQPLWKAVWHFRKRLNMELYDPGIPLLGITSEFENTYICMPVFTVALFRMAKK